MKRSDRKVEAKTGWSPFMLQKRHSVDLFHCPSSITDTIRDYLKVYNAETLPVSHHSLLCMLLFSLGHQMYVKFSRAVFLLLDHLKHQRLVLTALSERKGNVVMLNIIKASDVCLQITFKESFFVPICLSLTQWKQILSNSLQRLCLFLLLPLQLTFHVTFTCNGADLRAYSRVAFRVSGLRVSAKCRKCKWKMKQFCSLFTPRLFDPLHNLGDGQLWSWPISC